MKRIFLIPSAKQIPSELWNEFGPISHYLLPFNNDIALSHLVKDVDQKQWQTILGINKTNEKDFYLNSQLKIKNSNISVIDVGNTVSLGHTLYRMLKKVEFNITEKMPIAINFADTIIPGIDINGLSKDTIFYKRTNQLFRWTTFEIKDNQLLIKDKAKQDSLNSNVFIGFFYFLDGFKFFSCMTESLNLFKKQKMNLDPFYLAIQYYWKDNAIILEEASSWYDLGHVDNYFKAKRAFINTRYFNSFYYNEQTNTISKQSQRSNKLLEEINWYIELPNDLQYLTPKILNYDLNPRCVSVDLEYYGYPNLGELYIFGNLDLSIWDEIFQKLLNVLHDFSRHIKLTETNQHLWMIYVIKTKERLSLLKKLPEFRNIWVNKIIINGKEQNGLQYIYDNLEDLLLNTDLLKNRTKTIIHGDFCLSNILYDYRHGIIKLIDPRGSFDEPGLYGDSVYDIAKLTHSIYGGYEFLINNRFRYQESESQHFYDIYFREYHLKIQDLFRTKISHLYNAIEISNILLAQSLLFLSMVPLHKENIDKQKSMLLIGIEKFNSCFCK